MIDEAEEVLRRIRGGGFYRRNEYGVTYLEAMTGLLVNGDVTRHDARAAVRDGVNKIMLGVASGKGYNSYSRGFTLKQELRRLIDSGFVDQEEAHLAMIEGNRQLGFDI